VVLVPFGSGARSLDTARLLASRERVPEIDASCWREAFRSADATVFSRNDSCSG